MPRILHIEGFSVVVRPNDHPPPHVHVFRGGQQAKVEIGDSRTRPMISGRTRMPGADIKRTLEIVGNHQESLLAAWREIHG